MNNLSAKTVWCKGSDIKRSLCGVVQPGVMTSEGSLTDVLGCSVGVRCNVNTPSAQYSGVVGCLGVLRRTID